MSDHIQKTIDHALAELKRQEEAVTNTKKLVNQLCVFVGKPVMFGDADLQPTASRTDTLVVKNSFYGRGLSTCIREYLASRKNAGLVKEASLDDIFNALQEGGFDFLTIAADKKDAKRAVAINIGKNTATFLKLPSNDVGLLEWYPDVRKRKEKGGSDKTKTDDESISEEAMPNDLPASTESEETQK